MPRALSIDRGYLGLPSAYYAESPTRATFASSTDVSTDDSPPDSPITKAWKMLHERRKSKAEIEEDQWFGGLIDIEEQERKRKEAMAVAAAVVVIGAVGSAWYLLGGS